MPLFYRGQKVCGDLKVDLIVEDSVIVEIKAVERPSAAAVSVA